MSRLPNADRMRRYRERTSGNPMPSPAEVAAIRKRLGMNVADWTPEQWPEHMSQMRQTWLDGGLTLTEFAAVMPQPEDAERWKSVYAERRQHQLAMDVPRWRRRIVRWWRSRARA